MTAPAPLIDLEEYAEYVTGDALKETRLDGVIAAIRGYCGWHIAPAYDATFVVDGPGGRVLSLPTLRLNSVVSVTENGTELDADAFEWSHDGTLRRSCNWTERYRGIVVVANSGFDKIPADLLAVVIDAFAQAKAIPLNEPPPEKMGPFEFGGSAGGVVFNASQQIILDRYRIPLAP